jgi:UDP-2,3-diacylglucosamine pyrophosphatase LpxH
VKYIQSSYNGNHDELCLAPIGDIHIGSPHFDAKLLERHLNWIREHRENTRIILMGDLLETATKDSVGAGWAEQEERLNEHLYKAKNLFYEFRDIIDGIIEGNHELRVYQRTGLLLMKMFAQLMDLEDKYLQYQGVIKYSLNGRAYNVSVFHGAGGGRKTGSSVNRLEAQTETVFADLYLMGHTHKQHVHAKDVWIPDPHSMRVKPMTQWFVNTGHSLNYETSYAEQYGLPPSTKGFPLIYLNGKRDGDIRTKKIRVVV